MKILITGGAGFIGLNLVRHLAETSPHQLRVLDNLSAGQAHARLPDAVDFVHGDFTEAATLDACLRGVDVVVHLAAQTGVIDSVLDPQKSFDVNVAGSFALFEQARRSGVRKIIVASTGGALLGEVQPPIDESMPPSPMSPYGASKMAVEAYCSAYAGSYGLACAALRFSNIYGPHSAHKKTVVAAFIKQLLRNEPLIVYGDGTQQRDYLFVGDLVRGIGRAIDQNVTGTYQLGSGLPTSLRQIFPVLKKIVGRPLDVRFEPARKGEVHSTWCRVAKAQREFGFSAPTSLEAGIRATWDWYVANEHVWSEDKVLTASD